MRKNIRFSFLFIILLVIISLLINLAESFKIDTKIFNPAGDPIAIKYEHKGLPFMKIFGRDFSFRKGFDLQGGTSITLKANMDDIPLPLENTGDESLEDLFGDALEAMWEVQG